MVHSFGGDGDFDDVDEELLDEVEQPEVSTKQFVGLLCYMNK